MKNLAVYLIISLLIHFAVIMSSYNKDSAKRTFVTVNENIISIDIMQAEKGTANADNSLDNNEISQQEKNIAAIEKKEIVHKNALKKVEKKKTAENKKIKENTKKVTKTNDNKKQELKTAKTGNNMLSQTEKFIAGRADYIPKPKYPLASRRKKEEGTVIIKVYLNNTGRAEKWELYKSSGYAKLDTEALKVIKKAKFTPASSNGKPVSSHINLKITFDLKDL